MVSFRYDAAGQVIGKRFTNDAPVTMQYAAGGNRKLVRDSIGRTTRTFNAANQARTVLHQIDASAVPST